MDPLRTLFRHHAWATLRLIDHCAQLPAERMQETVPGTAGPILATLVHLLAADQRYLRHLDGQAGAPRIHESEEATLEDLRAAMRAQAGRWDAVLDRVRGLDVTVPRHREPDI